MIDVGVKEITLLGQNVNAWSSKGLDNQNWGLGRLIDELAKINELKFIRYTTSHPLDMDIELIKSHRDNKKLMPYLHLPVQSGSDNILKMMNRKHTAKEYLDAVDFMKRSYESYKEVFEDYHGVLSPCSTGVADKGLKSTGSADFNRVWSYMHTPAISLPLLQGENNLPLGVQLIGDKYDDHRFLGVARWLEQKSKEHNE